MPNEYTGNCLQYSQWRQSGELSIVVPVSLYIRSSSAWGKTADLFLLVHRSLLVVGSVSQYGTSIWTKVLKRLHRKLLS